MKSAPSTVPTSAATVANSSSGRDGAGGQDGDAPQRRLVLGDPAVLGVHLGVVERDGELSGDQVDALQPFGGERAPEEAVLEQEHRSERAAGDDRHGQQRARADGREVRVAGEAVVGGGVAHDQRLTGSLHVAQDGHRQRALVTALAGFGGYQPRLAVVAPQHQFHAGGAGHVAEHLDDARVQPLDAGLRAERA